MNYNTFQSVTIHFLSSGNIYFIFSVVKVKFMKNATIFHKHIINWSQHIGFLTLAEMAQVIEGNHGNDFKEG